MATRAKWRGGWLQYYDNVTYETIETFVGARFEDDFIGAGRLVIPAAGAPESGVDWCKKIVGAAPPTVAGLADAAGGTIECALTVDNQKQDAGLYMNDQRCFDLTKGLIWEARVNHSVLPTLLAESVIGVVGDWADGPDNILYSAFFTADGSGAIQCEMDDNATDRTGASGVTVIAGAFHIYRIDFTVVTDVRFYIDGVDVTPTPPWAYAGVGANAILQPYIGMYKSTGAGLGKVVVDYVRAWQTR